MNRDVWKSVINEAINGNEKPFNQAVTSNYKEHFYMPIQNLVKDEDLSIELYITSMTKFWERFVLWKEPLPDTNIDGYIYLMVKNAFFEQQQRKRTPKHNFISSHDNFEIVEKFQTSVMDNGTIELAEDQIANKQSINIIYQAIRSLDFKCREIIEQNILLKVTLQKLKAELGMEGTYNSIVQKKKRCLKMLRRILSKELKQHKINVERSQMSVQFKTIE